jgi:hypothetical protein
MPEQLGNAYLRKVNNDSFILKIMNKLNIIKIHRVVNETHTEIFWFEDKNSKEKTGMWAESLNELLNKIEKKFNIKIRKEDKI